MVSTDCIEEELKLKQGTCNCTGFGHNQAEVLHNGKMGTWKKHVTV